MHLTHFVISRRKVAMPQSSFLLVLQETLITKFLINSLSLSLSLSLSVSLLLSPPFSLSRMEMKKHSSRGCGGHHYFFGH